MKNNILIATGLSMIGLILVSHKVNAQDTRFTQFYASPLLINPAIMGASPDLRAGLCYRNQWGSVNSGYTTYDFNGMYPIFLGDKKGKLDVGLSVLDDKAGAYGNLNADLAVDYNKEIAEDQNLCLALFGGYGQQSISTGGLTYDDQYILGSSSLAPTSENMISRSKGYADVGFGFTWYMNPSRDKSKINAYAGIAGYHLNQPNQSMDGSTSRLPIKMSYIGGIKLFESNKVDISPNAMVTVQAGNIESALGAYVYYNFNDDMKLTLGLWYRHKDAIAVLLGFEYKGIAVGYSYDAVTSTLTSYATGLNANEITLSYTLKKKKSKGSSSMIDGSNSSSSGSNEPNPSPFPQL